MFQAALPAPHFQAEAGGTEGDAVRGVSEMIEFSLLLE
jgi:hypothetical protein